MRAPGDAKQNRSKKGNRFRYNRETSQTVEWRNLMAKKKKSSTFKVGRDAGTGKFIPVKQAERRKKTAVVETIKKKNK